MSRIITEIQIKASPETCFDLIRDHRIQVEPNPVIKGVFGLGQTVIFERSLLGARKRLIVTVVGFERPHLLIDEMTEGTFKSFRHIHELISIESGTLIRDTVIWASPFGIFGRLVDRILIRSHLRKLVLERNFRLKQIAEAAT